MDKLKKIKSKVAFLGYRVEEISFQANDQFVSENKEISINFDITAHINIIVEERMVVVTLEATVFKDPIENSYPFSMAIKISGGFQSEDDISPEKLGELAEINGTATLFPFLRSIVAGVCAQANVSPVVLPLINIYSLMQEQKNIKAQNVIE